MICKPIRPVCLAQVVAFMLILLFFFSTCYAEDFPSAENNIVNSDTTIEIIPIDSSMINAAKEFVQQLQSTNVVHASAMVYAPPGLPAYLVLSGSESGLAQAMNLRQRLLPDKATMPIVVIAASLRELSQLNSSDIGLNLVPSVSATAAHERTRSIDHTHTGSDSATITGTFSDMVALDEGLNKSKVLVSSEVFTPNGIKAQISNIKSVPIFSTDSDGNVQTQYQNLETSISVVPTVIEYNADNPADSLIRVDVDVKVSVISGTSAFKGVSAPEYSVKTMTTTRVLSADNQSNVIGSFVTDSDTKSTSGIPVLGKLPLLKYLFSHENKQLQRNTAILTLAVRLLPVPTNER